MCTQIKQINIKPASVTRWPQTCHDPTTAAVHTGRMFQNIVILCVNLKHAYVLHLLKLCPLSFCLQISIVSTDDDLSWFSWNPTPTVVHGGSNSLYSATTCLSKCIMSLPVEKTAATCGLYVNTMMKLVIFSQCKFSFFAPFWRSLTSFHNRGGPVFILRRTAEKRTSCLTPVWLFRATRL